MKEENGIVEISLDEAEKVTGGSVSRMNVFVCPKCKARFHTLPAFEAHCRAEHNVDVNSKGNSGKA